MLGEWEVWNLMQSGPSRRVLLFGSGPRLHISKKKKNTDAVVPPSDMVISLVCHVA